MSPPDPALDVQPGERLQALRAVEILLRIQRLAMDHFPGDDLETVAVFLTVAAASMAPVHRDEAALKIIRRDPLPPDWYRPISGRAVAASTGFARETVRRRLEHLIQAGQIDRVEGGYCLAEGALSRGQNLAFVRALIHELDTAHQHLARCDKG